MTNEQLLQLGVLVVFIGLIIIIGSFLFAAHDKERGKSTFKFSVVGFLGFIPFGFSNDKKLLLFGIILTIVVGAATMLLFSRNLKP
ncbi:hypothetical protein HYY73_04340 [Candidatus Woesearchaeota archaeon]|nr:hypothetical protein [Candidatus Woesearchaeota archaeon]